MHVSRAALDFEHAVTAHLARHGAAVRAPLARVPENAMKFAVGIMLTSFGTFWTAEGAGVAWPGGEVFLLAIIATVLALSAAGVLMLRPAGPPPGSS